VKRSESLPDLPTVAESGLRDTKRWLVRLLARGDGAKATVAKISAERIACSR